MFRHFVHSTLALSALLMGEVSQARDITIPYTGRFIEANAKPVEGPVDIVIEFFAKDVGGTSLASPQSFPAVVLDDGVFQLNISLSSAEFHKIVPSVDSPLWIQVTDATNGAIYPRQAMATSAFALKVPVDGTTISWNSDGQLELNKNAVVNKVGGQTFVTSGASAGQVLGWDAGSKSWKPTSVSISPSGIANGSISGDKIGNGTISNFASTGIDDNAASKAITINSGGNVGIGTTDPTASMHVRRNGEAALRLVNDSGTTKVTRVKFGVGPLEADNLYQIGTDFGGNGTDNFFINYQGSFSPAFFVDPSNNVGIGTYTPNSALNVFKNQNNGTKMRVTNPAVDTNAFAQVSVNTDASQLSMYSFSSGYTTNGRFIAGNQLVEADNSLGLSTTNGSLVLYTNAGTERMRIDQSGNVGIGTTVPTGRLSIENAGFLPGLVLQQNGFAHGMTNKTLNTDAFAEIIPYSARGGLYMIGITNDDVESPVYIDSAFQNMPLDATPGILFQTGIKNGVSTDPLAASKTVFSLNNGATSVIMGKGNGNVGIGTTSPQVALEVNGALRLNPAGAKPACSATTRGSFYVEQGAAGVTDTVYLCLKSAANTYNWISSTTGG